jgi:uncharacterized protein YbbC (DUF1343 family)/CubicO group peptidase (beta-lactamase class C family)
MISNSLRRKLFFAVFRFQGYFLTAFFLLVVQYSPLAAQDLLASAPQTVGMNADKLKKIDAAVERAIAEKKLPGAVVIVGHRGKIVYRQAFGSRSLAPTTEKMTVDTIFDVASLTKVVATATSAMILLERGELRLSDTADKFLPELKGKDTGKVTIEQLLTHTAGFAPDFDLREKWNGADAMLAALSKENLQSAPGAKFVYSDIGFIVLGEIVERVGKGKLDEFAKAEIFAPLKAKDSFFVRLSNVARDGLPSDASKDGALPDKLRERIAPTENVKGQQSRLGSLFVGDAKSGEAILRGAVHDPTAYRMNGVAGHAGLFSTADDLARFCQMILNGGSLDGARVLSPETIALMTKPRVVSERSETRGLGWDINTTYSSNRGELFPLGSFGHTGFTGTSIWVDPVSQTFVVFLSNRVHPDGKGDVSALRGKIATIAAAAVEDASIETRRIVEGVYAAQVAAEIEKFKIKNSKAKTEDQLAKEQSKVRNLQSAIVLNGIDVLEKENFKSLENLKIGLVTNQTGRDRSGKPTIDVLNEAKNLRLVALFSPEHGIRGVADDKVADSKDEKTGLPVYSLYGDTRRPTAAQMKNLDAFVFDIQDIGTRFYTYISTLLNVMEEAAKAGKAVVVLDRPNPINGVDVEGSLADADKLSFVAAYTLPVRHGLTIGEIAQMYNAEKKINCDLRVVKMENWRREMWFDQTNQLWTNPSPNMRSLTAATLYPGIGLLETTNLSVGRGTDTPFEIIGAPYIDALKLAEYLNNRNLAGARFVPREFTPTASTFKNEKCGGVNIIIADRHVFHPVQTGIEIAIALRKLYPNDWKIENYNKLLADSATAEKIKQAVAPAEIEKSWINGLEHFQTRRARFLLY